MWQGRNRLLLSRNHSADVTPPARSKTAQTAQSTQRMASRKPRGSNDREREKVMLATSEEDIC